MSTEHEKQMTGYPSIDKPWLKYYSEEAINAPLPECTMYQYIWENNKDHLSDVALRYYGSKITYGKLFENIQQAARAFSAMGIGAGDIVTIMSMHTPEMIYSFYALNYLGAAANMVYMTLSEKEIVETLDNTDSKLFFVLEPALERVQAVRDKISAPIVVLGVADSMPPHMKLGYTLKARPKKHGFLRWRDFLAHGEGGAMPLLSTDHMAPAVIVYTSGTTGEPKGVVLSNDCLNAHSAQELVAEFGFERGKTFLNVLPPFFGFGISHLHLTLNAGLEMTLWLVLKPKDVATEFFRVKPNFFVTGPAFVDAFIEHKPEPLHNLKLFVGGGGALSEKQERGINTFLQQCQTQAIYANGYGMTEACSTLCASTNEIYKVGSIGIPMPKTNIKILDIETGKELPFGEVGEMVFSSPNLMSGYYKNRRETSETIFKDAHGVTWIHTGDLGCVDEDGFIFIRGRIKRIYIVRGKDNTAYKLFPQRIEELMEAQDIVRHCGVIVKEDPDWLHIPVAFVELKSEADTTKEQTIKILKELSQRELPEHHRPEHIYILDSMPMTASGKIDYRALENKANLGEG